MQEDTKPTNTKPKINPKIALDRLRRQVLRRRRILVRIAGGLCVIALGFGGGWLGAFSRSTPSTSIVQQRTVLTNQAKLVSSIAKTVGESVVSVNVTSRTASSTNSLYSYMYGGGNAQTEESAGTGVVLTNDGLILTNRHVVPTGTTSVSVTLSDGTVLNKVKVVGRTAVSDSLDIAFL